MSKLIANYFSLGLFGDDGDWIEFRYYSGAQNQTYYSNVRYSFQANGILGSFVPSKQWTVEPLTGYGAFVLPLTTWVPDAGLPVCTGGGRCGACTQDRKSTRLNSSH